jgi:glycosyltransferase involved in cell wall biosynthesis
VALLHVLTPEYLPQVGGVADYTRLIARGLSDAGDEVHVWCPASGSAVPGDPFTVHAELGRFHRSDLDRTGHLLDQFPRPRRLLVQWVPHGYGFRAMNVPFCFWLWRRAARGDQIELMVHEAYLAFWEGSWRQTAAAAVHRFMTAVLLRAAQRVWISIPAWERLWKPYTFGRSIPFAWLPIPSGLNPPDEQAVGELRVKLGVARRPLIGHLGTYGSPITSLLDNLLPEVLRQPKAPHILLIGSGSEQFLASFSERHPMHRDRVTATGALSDSALAAHIAACDLLIQPYPDGISSRRTTAMAGLYLGVPIVTTRGYLTEPLWETSQAVRLAKVGDTPDFIAHVNQLLEHPDERQRTAERARALYDRMFDLRLTVAALRPA